MSHQCQVFVKRIGLVKKKLARSCFCRRKMVIAVGLFILLSNNSKANNFEKASWRQLQTPKGRVTETIVTPLVVSFCFHSFSSRKLKGHIIVRLTIFLKLLFYFLFKINSRLSLNYFYT